MKTKMFCGLLKKVIRRLRHFLCDCRACLIKVFGRKLFIYLILFVAGIIGSAAFAAAPPRMRPYTGIGLVVFSQSDTAQDENLQVPLYEEPGIYRVGMLNSSRLSGNEWIFGLQVGAPPLIVSARKGDWLRVFYDDAGREAWIGPQGNVRFQSWEQFLKLQTGRMLPALQPQYYQLHQQPGGKLLTALTPKQVFKVLKIENAWGMVLTDQGQIGWLRWCDDDGRLTIGTGKK
jgi:hypothetical protein